MKYKIEHKRILLLSSLICLFTIKAYPLQPNDSLTLDSSIRSGQLSNGISYYIKQIPDAAEKVHMGLVVKVGHNHQEEGEFQFAHIVEHLGFSAGKNISYGSSELFDEIGLNLGALRGNTWNDYTDFKMVVEGNNKKAIDVGLLFFEDVIWNLELTEGNIDRERIAVFNEINSSEIGINLVLRHLERKMVGYEVMASNGVNNHLKSFEPKDLIRFYKNWYRPDNMALVIVGDVKNIDDLEEDLKRRFAKSAPDLIPPINKNRHQEYLSKKPQFLKKPFSQLIEEPERMRAAFNFFIRDEVVGSKNSIDRLKNDLTKKMFVQIMNRRLREIKEVYIVDFTARTELAEAPFALKSHIAFIGQFDKEVLKEIIKGFVEVEQNGFSTEEFNEGKQNFIQSINKRNTSNIFYWRNEITSHYVRGEALPENKKKLEKTLIQNITLEEFNDKVKDYLRGQPDDITLAAHPGHPVLSYSEKDIRKWFSDFNEMAIKPYTGPHIPSALIDSLALSRLDKTAYTERETKIPLGKAFELENGIKVILRSSSKTHAAIGEKNKIYFQGFGTMGVSHFSEEYFFSAMNAPAIVMNSGVGDLDKFELERFLTAIDFKGSVRPFIEYEEAGIQGAASIEDMETAFQLAYLYLTNPNFSDVAFLDWKKKETKSLAIHQDINREDFLNAIRDSLMHQEFFPKGTKALQGLEQTDFERVKSIYRELFSNPRDLTFLFSGNFDEQEVLDLCRSYLGNLPFSGNTKISSKQMALPEIPITPYSKKIPSTTPMELAKVRLVYVPKNDVSDFDWKEEIKIEIMRRSMTELLMRRLRFESATGGTYMVGAGRYNSKAYNHNQTFIFFDCKPEDTKRLIAESKEVVDILRENIPEEKLFNKIKINLTPKEAKSETHQVILSKMLDFQIHGRTWVDVSVKRNFVNSLTPYDIWLTAKKYLSDEPFEFIMLP